MMKGSIHLREGTLFNSRLLYLTKFLSLRAQSHMVWGKISMAKMMKHWMTRR